MTRILLSLAFIMLTAGAFGQAYEDKITYDKKKQACIACDYDFSPEAVENAMVEKFKGLGYKVKEEKGLFNSDKGFFLFENAYVTDISRDRFDYIFKVERKSRKEGDKATLYMIIYYKDQNALTSMEAGSVSRAKLFLNKMLPDIEAADLEIQIRNQEENISKLEKKLKNLQDDKIELDKKIADNAKNQDETIQLLDTGKKDLEVLKGKRRK